MPTLNEYVFYIGAVSCAYIALVVTATFLEAINTYFSRDKDLIKEYGSWALVTGGTAGIGKSIAKELAKRKLNLVIISRNPEKLSAVAKEITNEYHVEVRTTTLDCSETTFSDYTNIYQTYKDLDIGIIVNNVAMAYVFPEYLGQLDTERMWKIIHTNILPATCLTKVFIESMVSKGGGLVVNVGSSNEIFSSPLLTVYSATKGYIQTFTDALRQEYTQKNIHFQVIRPFLVSTAMLGVPPSRWVSTPDDYARSAVATFGKTHFTAGHWMHSLQARFFGSIPASILTNTTMKIYLGARAKYYRKLNEKK